MNNARAPVQIPLSSAIPGVSHPSGCNLTCTHSHLTAVALDRLVKAGIDVAEIRTALDDEPYAHQGHREIPGLSPAGRQNLRDWGATQQEIEQIEGMDATGTPEPAQLSFAERERRRVKSYRDRLDPATKRARDAEAARRYRERKRKRDQEGRPEN